jgi:UTP--glucose-1-phosphate uridylyltransferase
MKITKAIIPAAGLGTRFLPWTKNNPKEMLPLLEKPAMQFIIEEGLSSGISEFHIIANEDKQTIKDYFSRSPALEEKLKEVGKESLLDELNTIIQSTSFNYIPQPQPLGLGHAVLMGKTAIGNDYFSICLPDEIMFGDTPALAQLITIAQKYNSSVIAVQEVPTTHVSSYGIIAKKEQLENDLFEIAHLVEKPTIDQAPSNLAIIGRYILSPRIFQSLEQTTPGAGGEIQLTDGIADMMRNGERVLAYIIKSTRHDIGNPLGWLQANMHAGLLNETYAPEIESYFKKLINKK